MMKEQVLTELNPLKKELNTYLPSIVDKLNNILEDSLEDESKSILFDKFHSILCMWFSGDDTSRNDTYINHEYTKKILVRFPIVECLLQNIYGSTEITKNSKFGKVCRQFTLAILGENIIRQNLSSIMDYGYRIKQITKDVISNDDKQEILSGVFEHLFTAFSSKESDVAGVVYTPSEVVNFMVESVHECLVNEFGIEQGLNDSNVNILDPCTGCGNFISAIIEKQNQVANTFGSSIADNIHGYEISLLSCYVSEIVIGKISADLSKGDTRVNAKIRWCDTMETDVGNKVIDNQFPLI